MLTSSSDLSNSMSAGQTFSTPLLSNLSKHEMDERDAKNYNEEEGKIESSQLSWWNCVAWLVLPTLLSMEFGTVFGMSSVVEFTRLFCMSGIQSTSAGLRWSVENYAMSGVVEFGRVFCKSGIKATTAGLRWFVENYGMSGVVEFTRDFCMSGVEATTVGLHWCVENYGIALFFLVNDGIVLMFFGIAIAYHEAIKDCKLICKVVLLAPEIFIIIILGDQLDSVFLFMHILCLAILGAAISFRGLITMQSSAEEEEEEDECRQLQDKLDVSLFKTDGLIQTIVHIV
jgi:hypothetical protein